MKKLLTVALAASMILAMSVNSFALGNYVLCTEEETPVEEQTPEVQEPTEETVPEETVKANPDTGAEDFVGVAAAAAVVAGIGIAALSKKHK